MRNDVHKPSAIQPDDYRFVAFSCVKIESIGDAQWALENRKRIEAHMAATGGKYSSHEHGGNCGVCGSVNAVYTALFHHIPTNTYIRVGQDCADQLDAGIAPAFRNFVSGVRDAREAHAGKQKARAILSDKGLLEAFQLWTAAFDALPKDVRGSLFYEEMTIRDIVGKLVKFGSVSDKALGFVAVLLGKIENRAAILKQREEEKEKAAPAPSGRVVVTGTVLKTEERESDFGLVTKMTVKDESGFVVWVTMPSGMAANRGDKVAFKATLTPSDNDPKFAFGKRPTMVAAPATRGIEVSA